MSVTGGVQRGSRTKFGDGSGAQSPRLPEPKRHVVPDSLGTGPVRTIVSMGCCIAGNNGRATGGSPVVAMAGHSRMLKQPWQSVTCATRATLPLMEMISHRELRNNSGQVLERVRNGDIIGVTNHGELAALLVPPNLPALDQLAASGRVREPCEVGPLGLAERLQRSVPTEAVLNELRGDQ